jgi:hypothetical protein
VGPPVHRLGDHLLETLCLRPQRGDLAVDALDRVGKDRPPLAGVLGGSEPLAVPLAGDLVLEQLAHLGEAEPGVVAEALDEPQALEVVGVVEPVVALGAGRRLEQAQLLVVADRPRREPGLGGDLLDAEEARFGGGRGVDVGHTPILPNLAVNVKVRVKPAGSPQRLADDRGRRCRRVGRRPTRRRVNGEVRRASAGNRRHPMSVDLDVLEQAGRRQVEQLARGVESEGERVVAVADD